MRRKKEPLKAEDMRNEVEAILARLKSLATRKRTRAKSIIYATFAGPAEREIEQKEEREHLTLIKDLRKLRDGCAHPTKTKHFCLDCKINLHSKRVGV